MGVGIAVAMQGCMGCDLGVYCSPPNLRLSTEGEVELVDRHVHGLMEVTVGGDVELFEFTCAAPLESPNSGDTTGNAEDDLVPVRVCDVWRSGVDPDSGELSPVEIIVEPGAVMAYLHVAYDGADAAESIHWSISLDDDPALLFSADIKSKEYKDPNGPGCGDCFNYQPVHLTWSDGVVDTDP